MSYFCTNPSPTSTRTPRATAPTERPENVPDDAILYSLFANDHGVPYRTFGDQIDDRKTPAITTIDPRRGNKKRWLTPEHQRAAIEYWTRNGNEWNWCERPSCPCHDYQQTSEQEQEQDTSDQQQQQLELEQDTSDQVDS